MTTTPTLRPDPTIALLDLADATCPMAFVKSRLFLDQRKAGETVEILYQNTAANEPLHRSILALGHEVSNRPVRSTDDMSLQQTAHKPVQTQSSTILLKSIFVLVKK